jgi:hypothetical protein
MRLWSAKIPSGGFQRNVTLLHSDRLPSEALCCAKIPSYFEALTDPRDKPIPLTFIIVVRLTTGGQAGTYYEIRRYGQFWLAAI